MPVDVDHRATMPGFHAGHAPGNKGLRYRADPPKVEEIIAVMRAAGDRLHGCRLRGLNRDHVARRAAHPGGTRAHRGRSRSTPQLAASPARQGRAPPRGRHGRVRMEQLQPWLDIRRELPVGPLLCVINGATRGRRWSSAAARAELRRTAAAAGVRRRFARHQLRHAHAVEMAREGVPLIVIQRQLGTATSASPASTSKASTAARSSRPCTPDALDDPPSAPRCDSDRRRKREQCLSRIAVVGVTGCVYGGELPWAPMQPAPKPGGD